jgi:hypothetical protein
MNEKLQNAFNHQSKLLYENS